MLVLVDLGTDPCTSMNLAISEKLGMGIGNWQALLNTVIFIFVIFLGRENIGFGTLANMFLVGYSLQFFSWVWEKTLPVGLFDSMAVRILVLIPALAIFVVAAAVYMDVKLGTAPYDAIPYLISARLPNVSFRTIRMCFDLTVTLIGWILGEMPGVVTALIVILLGPMISWMGNWLAQHFKLFREF